MKRTVDVPAVNVPLLLQLPPTWITPEPPSIVPPGWIVRWRTLTRLPPATSSVPATTTSVQARSVWPPPVAVLAAGGDDEVSVRGGIRAERKRDRERHAARDERTCRSHRAFLPGAATRAKPFPVPIPVVPPGRPTAQGPSPRASPRPRVASHVGPQVSCSPRRNVDTTLRIAPTQGTRGQWVPRERDRGRSSERRRRDIDRRTGCPHDRTARQIMNSAPPRIRRADARDATPLADLAERTFRTTFAPHNSDANMALHCARTYGEAIQAAEIADPARVTVVADDDGALCGYAMLRWGAAPACVVARRPAEVQRIYVDKPWHGRGVAQALMTAMLEHARNGGADRVWLGVWEHNPRARAFYRRAGFVDVGDHAFRLGDEVQRDRVMVRDLAEDATGATLTDCGATPPPDATSVARAATPRSTR